MPSPDPLLTLWAMISVSGGLLYGELVEDRYRYDPVFSPCEDRAKCMWMLRNPRIRVSPASRVDRHPGPESVTLLGCLWARVESGKASKALARFMPRPTVVLSDERTVKATALWALSSPVPFEKAEKANRAIARKLDCPRKHADPGGFLFDSTQSAWVNVDALYTGGELVRTAGLRAPPDPNAWRQRNAA